MHVIYFFIPVKLRYARPSNNIHSDTTWRWISILELCYCYWEYYHILLYSNIISWSWRLIRNPTRTASMLSLDYILDAAWRLKHDKEKWYYFIDFFFSKSYSLCAELHTCMETVSYVRIQYSTQTYDKNRYWLHSDTRRRAKFPRFEQCFISPHRTRPLISMALLSI